jgi:hypothetical protein
VAVTAGAQPRRSGTGGAEHVGAGWGIHNLFSGHEGCDSTPYITKPDFTPWVVANLTSSQEDNWFHPTRAGYAAMEKTAAQQIVIPAS